MQSQLNFDTVLVVTYGRSGSTLLQGVLNSIPEVIVRGENDNFIFGLYQAYKSLERAKGSAGNSRKNLEPTHSWYGSTLIDLDLFCQDCSALVRKILLADRPDAQTCYGFKEVRYVEIIPEFESYLAFLERIFPNVCFIFNTRKIEDVLKSGWWLHSNEKKSKQAIESLELLFQQYAASHPHNSFQITYEDIVGKTSRLAAMFQFLGAAYNEEMLDQVLSKRHSTITSSIELKNQFINYALADRESYASRIEMVMIDQIPEAIYAHQPFNLGGVVVPAQDDLPIQEIVAVYANADQSAEARIGLPSPIAAKRYPQITASANARFKFQNLTVQGVETLKIVARMVNGETWDLATVQVTPGTESKLPLQLAAPQTGKN